MRQKNSQDSFAGVEEAWRREYPGLNLDGFLMGAALIRIGKIIEQDLSRKCQQHFEISGAETGLLFALRRHGPPYSARPRTLTSTLLITSGAVTKQIGRLEARGLVSRAPDPNSLNGQIISLTQAGLDLVDRMTAFLCDHSVACEALAALPADIGQSGGTFYHALIAQLQPSRRDKLKRAPRAEKTS